MSMLDYEIYVYQVWYYDGLTWKKHEEDSEEKAVEYVNQNKDEWKNWRLLRLEVADM